jgi:hypothetical protein
MGRKERLLELMSDQDIQNQLILMLTQAGPGHIGRLNDAMTAVCKGCCGCSWRALPEPKSILVEARLLYFVLFAQALHPSPCNAGCHAHARPLSIGHVQWVRGSNTLSHAPLARTKCHRG